VSADNEEAYPQREFLEDMMTDLVEDIGVILERYRVEAADIVDQLVAVEHVGDCLRYLFTDNGLSMLTQFSHADC